MKIGEAVDALVDLPYSVRAELGRLNVSAIVRYAADEWRTRDRGPAVHIVFSDGTYETAEVANLPQGVQLAAKHAAISLREKTESPR